MINQKSTLGTNDVGRPSDLPEEPNPEGPIGGERGAQEGPISERTGRNPGNLGDEVPATGDVIYPSPGAATDDGVGSHEM